MNITGKAKDLIRGYATHRKQMAIARREREYCMRHIRPWYKKTPLSKEEKSEIAALWGDIVEIPLEYGYDYFAAYKQLHGFDATVCPPCYYFPYVTRRLNDDNARKFLAHKSLTDIVLGDIVKTPRTLFRSIGGVILDENLRPLTQEEFAEAVVKTSCNLIAKPASDSSGGAGVEVLDANIKKRWFDMIARGEMPMKGDFVVQEFVEQSHDTARLNPTSLNCFRVTTLNLNGKVSVCPVVIKFGKEGSITDNLASGGCWVGLDKDGSIGKFGINHEGELVQSHNKMTFEGIRISGIKKIEDVCLRMHRKISSIGIIGWDMALDADGEPVLIEGNMYYPGLLASQLLCGPIFGDRTAEVLEYCRKC